MGSSHWGLSSPNCDLESSDWDLESSNWVLTLSPPGVWTPEKTEGTSVGGEVGVYLGVQRLKGDGETSEWNFGSTLEREMSGRRLGWRFEMLRGALWGPRVCSGGPQGGFWDLGVDLGGSKIDAGVQDGFCGSQCQISQTPQWGGLWGLRIPRVDFGVSWCFTLSRMDLGISGWILGFQSKFLGS